MQVQVQPMELPQHRHIQAHLLTAIMQTPKRKRAASLDCTVSPYFSPSKRIKFDISAELNETPLLNSIQQQPHRVKQLEKELFRLKPALIQGRRIISLHITKAHPSLFREYFS
jgi:hypothetical protein